MPPRPEFRRRPVSALGIARSDRGDDTGRFKVTDVEAGRHAFKTRSLASGCGGCGDDFNNGGDSSNIIKVEYEVKNGSTTVDSATP